MRSATPRPSRSRLHLLIATCCTLAATLATSSHAFAQTPDRPEEIIRGVIGAWHAAEERLDAAVVRALLTEDYFHITSWGQVLSASDLLGFGELTREHPITRRYERGPVTVRVHGAAAVAHYPYEYRDGGSPLEGKYWNTVTLVHQRGEWKIASSHSSRVNPLASVQVLEIASWPVVPLTREQRALYVGSYDTGSETVRVWEEHGQLLITPGENSPVKPNFLVPMGDHTFAQGHFEDGVLERIYWPGTRIRFVVEAGRVRRYELVSRGQVRETGERRNE